MANEYSNWYILQLLEWIDAGEAFSEKEKKVLSERRALDLSGTRIFALPESVGQLVNLQMLNLWNTPITALPESIGQLAML